MKKLSCSISILLCLLCQSCESGGWQKVPTGNPGMLSGISGLELLRTDGKTTSLVVAHDNKQAGEPRIALVTLAKDKVRAYTPLTWTGGEWPSDLEALVAVPESEPPTFLAMTSSGRIFHLAVDEEAKSVSVKAAWNLPSAGGNAEGLGLMKAGAKLVAVWGYRGEGRASPGRLFWGFLDIQRGVFSEVSPGVDYVTPSPSDDTVRHISDIKALDDGTVMISAATDHGDNGPFDSAVFLAGALSCDDTGRLSFSPEKKPRRIHSAGGHKIEGLAFAAGESSSCWMGTDDENSGSSVCVVSIGKRPRK